MKLKRANKPVSNLFIRATLCSLRGTNNLKPYEYILEEKNVSWDTNLSICLFLILVSFCLFLVCIDGVTVNEHTILKCITCAGSVCKILIYCIEMWKTHGGQLWRKRSWTFSTRWGFPWRSSWGKPSAQRGTGCMWSHAWSWPSFRSGGPCSPESWSEMTTRNSHKKHN